MNTTTEHLGELTLRRHRAGEALGGVGEVEKIDGHLAACAACKVRLRALDDEQRRFEQEISFDRFAAGVERAAREKTATKAHHPRATHWWTWSYPALAMAAGVALVITFVPRASNRGVTNRDVTNRGAGNRIKGGAGVTVRVAGVSGQRTARVDAAEPLAPGDRLRIGYQSGGHRYLLSLSIDQHGQVTPLYPEAGTSLPVPEGADRATRYLPDSLELTGAGIERIIVVLSDQPIDVEAARRAARAAYDRAGGDLSRLPPLALPGEEFERTFAKP
ncbi:MAG TPA: ACP synthase [Polyangia bacterium]|nr:ACP synthase [Polyangia bacterium]